MLVGCRTKKAAERKKKKVWSYGFYKTLLLMLLLCALIVSARPGAAVAGFQIPEKFVYDLTWAGIKAGTASLEVINQGDTLKIISTARSASWVSVFYTVDDRIVSTLLKSPGMLSVGRPLNYRIKLREGKHRKDKEVVFDPIRNKAHYTDYIKNEKREFEVPPNVFDPISSFYYLRNLTLKVGENVSVTMFDSKKVWEVEVQVLRREKITLPIGTFNTIVVKPVMQSEGIFYRKGEVYIWLTDDDKHIPVKMQTKIVVGHVNATLVQGIY